MALFWLSDSWKALIEMLLLQQPFHPEWKCLSGSLSPNNIDKNHLFLSVFFCVVKIRYVEFPCHDSIRRHLEREQNPAIPTVDSNSSDPLNSVEFVRGFLLLGPPFSIRNSVLAFDSTGDSPASFGFDPPEEMRWAWLALIRQFYSFPGWSCRKMVQNCKEWYESEPRYCGGLKIIAKELDYIDYIIYIYISNYLDTYWL